MALAFREHAVAGGGGGTVAGGTAAGVGLASSFHLARASLSPSRFGAEVFVCGLLQQCYWAPRLVQFYATQTPDTVSKSSADAGAILRKYLGREEELFARLERKYNAGTARSARAMAALAAAQQRALHRQAAASLEAHDAGQLRGSK